MEKGAGRRENGEMQKLRQRSDTYLSKDMLSAVYGSVDNIDPWVGGVSEEQYEKSHFFLIW